MRNRWVHSFREEMHGRERLAVYYTCFSSSEAHIQNTFPSNAPCRQIRQPNQVLANNWERKLNVPHLDDQRKKNLSLLSFYVLSLFCWCDPNKHNDLRSHWLKMAEPQNENCLAPSITT